MAVKYSKKRHAHNNILYTVITVLLLCAVFLAVVDYFYNNAIEEAYDDLHMQTKQIKDDLSLQLHSDHENLETMANFAAKLHTDGESYEIMFNSFKPIGLIENIGILNPDNTFVTKAGTINLSGKISFDAEKERGNYISGRVPDLTKDNYEIIRSAAPIRANGDTVGILYGVIKLDTLDKKYGKMANELDAQLFVHETAGGNLVIDTLHDTLGNISFLKDREYNEQYSYEEMMNSNSGFASFVSAYTGEDLYVHYSKLEDLGWTITLARYESQVFAKTQVISRVLFVSFFVLITIMFLYMIVLLANERELGDVTKSAAEIRRTLLETSQQENNIAAAIKQVCLFVKARSAVFFDTDGEDFCYIRPQHEEALLLGEDRKYLMGELFRYAAELHKIKQSSLVVMCVKPNKHLQKKNEAFYRFLTKHEIKEISFVAVFNKNNHITVLGAVNPRRSKAARNLAEKVAVCFSIALFNKKHLNRTELAATTDSLTGVLNRVPYQKDILRFNEEKPQEFSCLYIDVNELHNLNNRYGHDAGDDMLVYVANTLKEVFYGHLIYRIGGDEFLVFAKNTDPAIVKEGIAELNEQLALVNYSVSVGMSYRTQNTNTEDMIKEAEARMSDAKALYYQDKEQKALSQSEEINFVQIKTGIPEIDAMLAVMHDHYNGIYRVSLETDKARRILMPAYLNFHENEEHFSAVFSKYVAEMANPDFHRALTSFLNYDTLKRQLLDGKTPKITYKKINGDTVILSVYALNDPAGTVDNTLWVFAKD